MVYTKEQLTKNCTMELYDSGTGRSSLKENYGVKFMNYLMPTVIFMLIH